MNPRSLLGRRFGRTPAPIPPEPGEDAERTDRGEPALQVSPSPDCAGAPSGKRAKKAPAADANAPASEDPAKGPSPRKPRMGRRKRSPVRQAGRPPAQSPATAHDGMPAPQGGALAGRAGRFVPKLPSIKLPARLARLAARRAQPQGRPSEPDACAPQATAPAVATTDKWEEVPAYLPVKAAEHPVIAVIATAIAAGDRPQSIFTVKRISIENPEHRRVAVIASALAAGALEQSAFVVKRIYRHRGPSTAPANPEE